MFFLRLTFQSIKLTNLDKIKDEKMVRIYKLSKKDTKKNIVFLIIMTNLEKYLCMLLPTKSIKNK